MKNDLLNGWRRCDGIRRNVGDAVAEAIDVDHLANLEVSLDLDAGEGKPDKIACRGADILDGRLAAEVRRNRGENVSSVKRATDRLAEKLLVLDSKDAFDFLLGEGQRENAVVRADEDEVGRLDGYGRAITADAGVDNGDMNRVGRVVFVTLFEGEGARHDVARRDFMSDVDDAVATADADHDAFHRADKPVARSKVGGQGDESHKGIVVVTRRLSRGYSDPMIMQREQPKVVVITGATRGLGRTMAMEFINREWMVVGCGSSQQSVTDAEDAFTDPHRLDVVDVASDDVVREWADEVMEELGPPALLLNNAALINRSAPLIELEAREFDRVIDVNIKGVANVIRHFTPAMIENGSGVIVNFSSGWGRSTSPEVAPYCATKWAIEGLTQALAQELPTGLAAIPLNPGVIDTDMLRSCFGGAASGYPSPEEWAKRAVPTILGFGASDNGRPMSV